MQEFLDCYSNGVFGVAYLILGIVAIAIFGKEMFEIRRDKNYLTLVRFRTFALKASAFIRSSILRCIR